MHYLSTLSLIAIASFTKLVYCGVSTEDNVCMVPVEKEEIQLERYIQSVPYKTTVLCPDISKGFKCSMTKYGEKIAYRNVPKIVTIYVKQCCDGYTNASNDKCIPVCNPSCENGNCTAPNHCTCEPGYAGPSCAITCLKGFWGSSCRAKCECLHEASCDPISGICFCPPGYHGKHCEKPCNDKTWGPNCRFRCLCGNNSTCNPIDGSCKCSPGFSGSLCLEECVEVRVIPQVSMDPTVYTIVNVKMVRIATKKMVVVCVLLDFQLVIIPNFFGLFESFVNNTGRFCENKCQKGYYGINCTSKCFCYNENECDQITGECHCIGFTGKHCEQPCPKGTFGKEFVHLIALDQIARTNALAIQCHPTIGSCSCRAGYTGAGCNSLCPTSYYGENCENKCDCNLNTGSQCDPVTGQCICAAGYQGIRCDDKCPEGLFGKHCESKCNCKNGASCDHRYGVCNCTVGWRGPQCNLPCWAGYAGAGCKLCNCKNNAGCDPLTGECICRAGWTGKSCEMPCDKVRPPLMCPKNMDVGDVL
uniref:Multiple epidermal growth factor-like domains protein 10 n=1 Tax=Setaria digitata TaxID=48799 RepID=A0A915Q4T7_9BILA